MMLINLHQGKGLAQGRAELRRREKGKKNKTPQSAKRKVNKQQGRILFVGAKPQKCSEVSADSQDQPPASKHEQSGDQPSASKQSSSPLDETKQSQYQVTTLAEETELLQPMQPEDTCDIVSPRGGPSDLSPYDRMEDNISKNSY